MLVQIWSNTLVIVGDYNDDQYDETWKVCEASKSASVDVVQLKKGGGAINLPIRMIMLVTLAMMITMMMMMLMTMAMMITMIMIMMMMMNLSLRDAKFFLDFLGEESVVPTTYD